MLAEVLAPNTRRLYWKGYIDVRVEQGRHRDRLRDRRRSSCRSSSTGTRAKVAGAAENVLALLVPQHHVVVLYVDGKAARLLEAGLHAFWKSNRDLRGELVDLRLQVLEVAGQEILTRDKVTLRVNLTAGYRVTDVLIAFAKQAKPVDFLYKELQFGLRAAVGTRTLDELLENKSVIDEVVGDHIRRRVQGFGLEVESVGVKDIILPGDMKVILAKVVEAEKAAQANVIRRREETAATRSLLNTAQGDGRQPDRAAAEGAGDAREGHREDRQDLGVRRPRGRAEGSGEDPLVRTARGAPFRAVFFGGRRSGSVPPRTLGRLARRLSRGLAELPLQLFHLPVLSFDQLSELAEGFLQLGCPVARLGERPVEGGSVVARRHRPALRRPGGCGSRRAARAAR